VQVKELTLEQIHRLLDKGLNQFDDNVLRTELHWRHADTQDSTSLCYRGNRTTQDAITALLKLNNNRDRILALYEAMRREEKARIGLRKIWDEAKPLSESQTFREAVDRTIAHLGHVDPSDSQSPAGTNVVRLGNSFLCTPRDDDECPF
jgi:hypothetical protein